MRKTITSTLPSVALMSILLATSVRAEDPVTKPNQYEIAEIAVPAASADETIRAEFSARHAFDHLDNGALAWSRQRKCVTCHTNGSYMVIRPALTPYAGKPLAEIRDFFVAELAEYRSTEQKELQQGTHPAQVIYVAAGLAEWDVHVSKRLSQETDEALRLMFSLQQQSGTWGSLDCWPPFESSAYHLATVALMAAATAPGWLQELQDEAILEAVERLKSYLQTTPPPHDYGRLLLLWASTRMPGLIDAARKESLVELIWRHQRADGGWSIRTFSAPQAWGRGNRAEKLQTEAHFDEPQSDGHLTGLAVVVLRDSGVPAEDPRIARAVKWLLENQRQSGRWWTRSLNTDNWHFITFSGTCYPLLALAKCQALPATPKTVQ